MLFVDVNTNYNDSGGGIRTYHETKLAWFRRHPEHTYYLVVPGPARREIALADNIRRVEFYGVPLGGGYRLFADLLGLYRFLKQTRADVVELGDSIWAGPFCLAARKLGRLPGLFTSFYHSDPIHTWIARWQRRSGLLQPARNAIGAMLSRLFYRVQRNYDRTVVTSRVMERQLTSHGVARTTRMPFGLAEAFTAGDDALQPRCDRHDKVKLLYSGRLGADKAIELVEQVLPRLLGRDDVEVTVMGRSLNDHLLCHVDHPRYRYLGYIADRREVARIYREHDILLAPGPYETFGLGVLEASACGLIVVGPNAGGTGELLAELPRPFVFPAGDVNAFYETIERAVACDFAAHAADSRRLAAAYGSSDHAVARLVAYYEREVHGRAKPPEQAKAPPTGPHWTPTAADARCRS
jgi:alpha-1,6-mannosyltransferase